MAGEFYAVHVVSDDENSSSSSGIFGSLEEAVKFAASPERKDRARFKKFTSPHDARRFAEKGDLSPYLPGSNSLTIVEPCVPYPSLSPMQFNDLKRAVERKDNDTFTELVALNPRYLINVGSDTPAIVVEGFRYNTLHIAAKVDNSFVTRYVLSFIKSTHGMLQLYGTSKADVEERSSHLLDCYLNTPEKGALDTPLHIASKFGHLKIVKLLLGNDVCRRDLRNKDGKTAAQVCCTRRNIGNYELTKSILLLLQSIYVPLYRPRDDYYRAIIKPPCEDMDADVMIPMSPRLLECHDCQLVAYAGPFLSEKIAEKFYEEWTKNERVVRRVLSRKSTEHFGRQLALKFKVSFRERWNFSSEYINLQTPEGLEVLNRHLVERKLKTMNSLSGQSAYNVHEEDQFDEFFDACDPGNNGINDSLGSLASKTSDLRLDDSFVAKAEGEKNKKKKHVAAGNSEETLSEFASNVMDDGDHNDDLFFTPPSSPEPFYINDELRSQDDCDLVLALSLVDEKLLRKFGAVSEYVRQVQGVPESERRGWPTSDSPRAVKSRKRGVGK